MTRRYVRPGLVRIAVITIIACIVVLRITGALTVGVVATGSMEPTLPVGTLFLSIPTSPSVGDIIVFTSPSGDRIVHRVIESGPQGLTTKGDANPVSDQQAGWPPVDPEGVEKVPAPGGLLLAFVTPIKGAIVIIALQLVLIGLAFLSGIHVVRRRMSVRPHHVLVLAAVGLLFSAPLFAQEYHDPDEILVTSSFFPVVVHVEAQDGSGTWRMGPFDEQATGLTGPASVTIAPAAPGADRLAPHGPSAAFLPFAVLVGLVALAFRFSGGDR